MKRKTAVFWIVFALVAVMAMGCTQGQDVDAVSGATEDDVDAVSEATLARYEEREVREYEGMKLDPAVGPRDNSISGTQYVEIEDYTLSVTGLVDTPQTLSYDEVIGFDQYERLITLYCVEGWEATILWKGVRLMDIIEAAGVQDSATVVIFKAVDGYTTSLPLDVVASRDLLLAYQSNGIDLPPEMGYPFIVVAEDKLGYKWARWVSEIELYDDENYLGYWEERGYSNSADVDPDRR